MVTTRLLTCFTAIGALMAPSTVFAQSSSNPPASDTLIPQAEAVRMALENNPDLQALVHYLQAERTKIQQAKEFPSTSVDFDFDQQVEIFRSDEMYYGFSQEIEFPTRIGLRGNLARREVEAAENEHQQSRWELTLVVKSLYQELSLAQQSVAIAKESLAIAGRLHQMAQQKYSLGSVGKLDVLRAGVEEATAANSLSKLETEERSLRMQLNYLIGRPAESELSTVALSQGRIPGEEAGELVDLALRSRKELHVIQSKTAASEVLKSLVRSEYYPDFQFGFARHHLADDLDNWDITASISIPLFGRAAIGGRVAEAEAQSRGLRAEEEAARTRIEFEVRDAYWQVGNLSERVRRYDDQILAQAEEAFRIAQASYREGEIENLELLESQRTLQEVRQGFADTVFSYNLALISLEGAVGREIGWESPSGTTAQSRSVESK